MGQGYGFKCSQCGHEEDILEGQGFMVHGLTLKEYLNHPFMKFHPSTHRKILRLSKKLRGLQIFCEYRGYLCPTCNIPATKLYVEVYKGGTIYHQSSFRCKKCNHELVEKKIDLREVYNCPSCNSPVFMFGNILWE